MIDERTQIYVEKSRIPHIESILKMLSSSDFDLSQCKEKISELTEDEKIGIIINDPWLGTVLIDDLSDRIIEYAVSEKTLLGIFMLEKINSNKTLDIIVDDIVNNYPEQYYYINRDSIRNLFSNELKYLKKKEYRSSEIEEHIVKISEKIIGTRSELYEDEIPFVKNIISCFHNDDNKKYFENLLMYSALLNGTDGEEII